MFDTQTILHCDTSTAPQRADQSPCASRVLLRASGLAKSFGGRRVLDGVNLELREGEVVLLRGDNGSGKTTLLNILTGNLAPDSGTIHLTANGNEETFQFPRRWWYHMNPLEHFLPERVAREGVGRSWQDTRLFPTVRLVENVAVAEPQHPGESPLNVLFRPARVKRAEAVAHTAAMAMLDALGLGGRGQSSADMISLGQTKRVAIARAASAGGRILFLDEPLAGLDNDGVQAVLHLLRQLAAEHKVTLVIIEHVWNVHHILDLATTVWSLRDGGLTSQSLGSRTGTALRLEQTGSSLQFRQLTVGLRQVCSLDLPGGASLSVYRNPDYTGTGELLLEAEGLVVRRGKRPVIGENNETQDVSSGLALALRDGDLAILQAPNGWGKTTLIEALAGFLPFTQGTFRLLRKDLTHAPVWRRSQAGLCVFRAFSRAFPSLRVRDALFLAHARSLPVSLTALLDLTLGQLSAGELQAVRLLQVMTSTGHVYLFDEPFSALDHHRVTETIESIRAVLSRPRSAVILSVPGVRPDQGSLLH